jgi:hypothetical protein
VNPWRLQTWMGHKRIDETMLYVHVAEAHARELPDPIREASLAPADPDARIIAMLGARALAMPAPITAENRTGRGKNLAKTEGAENENAAVSAA